MTRVTSNAIGLGSDKKDTYCPHELKSHETINLSLSIFDKCAAYKSGDAGEVV